MLGEYGPLNPKNVGRYLQYKAEYKFSSHTDDSASCRYELTCGQNIFGSKPLVEACNRDKMIVLSCKCNGDFEFSVKTSTITPEGCPRTACCAHVT